MAEIYTTTTPMSDALVAAVTTSIKLSLSDRSGGGLLANPVIAGGFQGRERLMGALGAKTVFVGWGADKLSAVAQGTGFTVTTLDSDAATVTPARRGIARTVSDMARALDAWGLLEWGMFGFDSTTAWQQSIVALHTALFPSFSEVGGNSGGAATWGQMVADFQTLTAKLPAGPVVAVLRPKDWASIATDAMSIGGRVQMRQEMDQVFGSVSNGFKGIFMNGDLWIYTSDEVVASAGDHVSAMFGANAIEWNAVMPAPSPATIPLLWTPVYGVELGRTALKTEDTVVTSTHAGASIGLDDAGIQMPFLT
jgi:hypothetical protein